MTAMLDDELADFGVPTPSCSKGLMSGLGSATRHLLKRPHATTLSRSL